MDNRRVAIFDAKPHDREFFDRVNKKYNVDITYFDQQLSRDTVACAQGYAAICIFVHDIVTADVINVLYEQGTRLIALRCAGCNNIDSAAARGKIKIVNVPAYSPYAVAEYTVGMLLCLTRKLHRASYKTRDNNFVIEDLLGYELRGKVAGIIGVGRIGSLVVTILQSLGMRVLAYDLDASSVAKTGALYTTLPELFSQSNVISLHCNLTQENHHIINKEAFDCMQPGTILINTARGELVDSIALLEAIKEHKIAAVGIDVYEHESELFYRDYSAIGIEDDTLARLLSYPQILITSHQAFFTREAVTSIVETTLQNVSNFYDDRPLSYELI